MAVKQSASSGAMPAPSSPVSVGRRGRRPRALRTLQAWLWAMSAVLLCAFLLTSTAAGRSILSNALLASPIPYVWSVWQADNPVCSPWQAAMGLREAYRITTAAKDASRNSRLIRTDEQGRQLWQTPFGEWWYPSGSSEESIRFSIAQYELAAYPGLEIRRGDVVLDCGGFVGDWAHWVLQAGASRVIVFEPAAGQLECIRRNLAGPLQDGRAMLIPKGVWDRDEELTLTHWDDNPAGHSVVDQRSSRGETIQLTTIDAVVRLLGLERVDVIKMDIEGAEVRALRGARETLNRFRPRLAVATEHTADRVQNNRDVIATIREIAPFYTYRCGYCVLKDHRIVPETLYFDPR